MLYYSYSGNKNFRKREIMKNIIPLIVAVVLALAAVFLAAMWLKFIITFLFYGASLNRAIQVKISRECST